MTDKLSSASQFGLMWQRRLLDAPLQSAPSHRVIQMAI
jgi:hypothetical protein